MKVVYSSILILSLISSVAAYALPSPVAVIANNPEVKSLLGAIESNRKLRCDKIDFNNTKISNGRNVVSTVVCNEYDQDGTPMANVHWIEIKGKLYNGTFFDLESVKITAGE